MMPTIFTESQQTEKEKQIAEEILKDFGQLSGDRGNEEAQWQEIAERVIPMHSNTFMKSPSQNHGDKKTEKLFDSTASIALQRFAAILDSLLTPRNQTWHNIQPSDMNLSKNREVRLWFEQVNRILFKYRYAPKANFASQNQQNYLSLGAYGTGAMYTDALFGDRGLRYKAIHIGEIYFAENHQGMVDKSYRYFPFTARQAVQKWKDKCPAKIREKAQGDGKNPEEKFWFIHCVKPREDYDPARLDSKGKPFASYYVSEQDKRLLADEGYDSFPYSVSRYIQNVGEIYGRSPAMEVLPAIKTLNEEKKTLLKQGHRAVSPVLLAHDDGIMDAFDLRPDAVNYGAVTADGRPLVHALQTGNLAVGKDLMDDERLVINDSFLVNLFQVLTETPAMTATEVMERTREKGILLAPTIGRQQSEYLGPLIEREIDVLMRQGLIPQMPRLLVEARGEYKIEYNSPLSRAQRAEEASGLMRTVETALQAINITQNPEPLDYIDWDVVIPEIAAIHGVPASFMRSAEDVQKLRASRAQAAQAQQMISAAPGAAAMMKAIPKVQEAS